MEIPDLETVYGGVRQSGIVDGGAQCSTAAMFLVVLPKVTPPNPAT